MFCHAIAGRWMELTATNCDVVCECAVHSAQHSQFKWIWTENGPTWNNEHSAHSSNVRLLTLVQIDRYTQYNPLIHALRRQIKLTKENLNRNYHMYVNSFTQTTIGDWLFALAPGAFNRPHLPQLNSFVCTQCARALTLLVIRNVIVTSTFDVWWQFVTFDNVHNWSMSKW